MSNQSIQLNDELYHYLLDASLRESEVLKQLRQHTAGMRGSVMQIAPEQGQFMALLVQILGAKKTLEVGVYTGYSALCVAAVLPEDGRMIACDINEETTAVAKEFWQKAGVAEKIDLRLAPGAETLNELIETGEQGSFDFAFIDADKTGYHNYYEQCLVLLRPGGLIAVDNVLWTGSVLNNENPSEDTQALQAFNCFVKDDQRVDLSMLPVGDGLTLLRKK
ncbi:MAG: class I SAM-dependent methyltransferase [Porticoccaceae bacterium]|nr:class I SAM-dependent methyltransferase [Porticoccaceae bacterium]